MISIIFGVCISDSDAYEKLRPIRGPVVKGIPIRPLDYSTIKRISRKHVPLNPDSEPIFLPVNAAQFKPYQVMERISSAPPHPNLIRNRLNHHNLKKNDNFNFLNFDAYLMKPMNGSVKVKKDPNRGLQFANQTESFYEDAKSSSSTQHKYRSKPSSKKSKQKGNRLSMMPVRDMDFELYKAILEQQKQQKQQKQAETMEKLHKMKHINHLNVNPIKHAHNGAKLPIGIDYFEQKSKNKSPYPPITYAPIYLDNLKHRSHHHEDVEASNIYVRTQPLEMLQNEEMPLTTTTGPSVLPTFAVPIEVEMHQPEEAKSYHKVANAPEMYKFTVDDAVIRPIISNPHSFNGPVTLSPQPDDYPNQPDEHFVQSENVPLLNMNNGIENIPASIRPLVRGRRPMNHHNSHYQTQINHPPNEYTRTGYRRLEPSHYSQQYHPINHNMNYESNSINSNMNHMAMEVSASSRRQSENVSLQPIVMTTQMTVAADNNPDTEQPVATTTTIESVRRQKKRRRPIKTNRYPVEQSEANTENARQSAHHSVSNNNNLEVSSSYTKRRTQGYNSEEDDRTTPISPIKLKSVRNTITSESKQITSTVSPHRTHAISSPRIMQKSKYFS